MGGNSLSVMYFLFILTNSTRRATTYFAEAMHANAFLVDLQSHWGNRHAVCMNPATQPVSVVGMQKGEAESHW